LSDDGGAGLADPNTSFTSANGETRSKDVVLFE
jgi:hypothetical protein